MDNGSDRLLRPSVIYETITNGYPTTCAASGGAEIRTVVDTARLTGGSPFGTIFKTISG